MSVPLWRQIQRQNFTDWKKLLAFLQLDQTEAKNSVLLHSKFPLNVPARLVEKMEPKNWSDPLLRQFLPTQSEQKSAPLFMLDPVGDNPSRKTPKLLCKYKGRALLVCTGACAMHCRYCFRQHYEYETADKLFTAEIEAIAADTSLSEVLLSGGDPLSLSDAQIGKLLHALEQIPHVKRIRFHTRFPIGIPERIDESFLAMLKSCAKQILFVIHCNHPNEFDEEIFLRLKAIQQLGIPILTQSVLLQGVNDSVEVLRDLFLLLVDNGIFPYYLHQLDRVQGAAHFEVSEEEGKELMHKLAALLPGYAIPKYVREIPGHPGKTPLI